MKAGDVCRCISEFTGISTEELTLYKNDIVQVHEVVDKHWLRGEGGGSVGLVPSSVLVKVDGLPPHPPHQPLFVASAEFVPSQPGDLGFSRGDFVVGLNPVDESWWCGQSWGKKGIFPLTFVWRINEDIIQVEDTSEKAVRLQGRVRTSIRAQLPEELNLYAGDLVNITHIVDKDWYRGESNGATGIFPKNFVDLVDEPSVPSSSVVDPMESNITTVCDNTPSSFSLTGGPASGLTSAFPHHNGTSAHSHQSDAVPPSIGYSSSSGHHSLGQKVPTNTTSSSPQAMGSSDPSVRLSKTSTAWKTIDADDDLFDDDYFKQNMPGLYSSKGGGAPSVPMSDNASTPTPANSASTSLSTTGSKLENIRVSHTAHPSSATHAPHSLSEGEPNYFRYENIEATEPQSSRQATEEAAGGAEWSTFVEEERMKSLTQKVEDYLSSSLLGDDDMPASMSSSTGHFWPYRGPSYNEDNTGIEPYGRAIFSFKAQYPNELTFKKGEIVHLLQHVDSHWTLGRSGEAKGIFPTSYVEIIVDCLHSEEQHFLARPETVHSASQPVRAVAQYDFQAVQVGDVSMKKGDNLRVLKEVDANWVIVDNMTGSEGMCPKNYLSFLKDGESLTVEDPQSHTPRVQQPQSHTPDSSSDATSEQRSQQTLQDSAPERSRSSSPFSASWQRRSYNKDDFGSIKKQEVEPVLARNIASLDATTKTSMCLSEKREGESVFLERETSPAEELKEGESQQRPSRLKPTILPRQSKIPPVYKTTGPESSNKVQDKANNSLMSPSSLPLSTTTTTESSTSVSVTSAATSFTASTASSSVTTSTVSTTSTRSGSFSTIRPAPSPQTLSQKKVLNRSNSLQSETGPATSMLRPSPSPPQPQPQPRSQPQPQPSSNPHPQPQPQPRYVTESSSNQKPINQQQSPQQSQPQPPPVPSQQAIYSQVKRRQWRNQEKEEGKELSVRKQQQSNDSNASSASFPEDVSHLSVASEAVYPSETSLSSTSSGLVPQRPAPPPPPKLPDQENQEEQYYSLTPCEPGATESQATETAGMEKAADEEGKEVTEEGQEGADKGATALAMPKSPHANMRRVVIQEIVTTEHEYIHDLEALMQVVQLAPSRPGGSQGVHLPSLLGNITEIVEVAKKFARLLDQSAYGDSDEELCVGKVFLACAEEMCQTYKVYCANHNVTVEPLMQKYEQEQEPAAFLQWVLEELQQHKIQLLDMRSVLIKPLQRVLKYPLFLDRLVRDTPENHPDHKDLLEAKTAMANTAKEINDYTKRLDLVNKYRTESDQSLHSKMQRVSLHSVAKKSARISTIVSEMLGIMVQTKDPKFDEEVVKFRALQRWVVAMAQDIEGLLQGVRARHRAELAVVKGLVDTLLHPGTEVEAVHKVAADSAGRLFESFDNFVRQRVMMPTKQLVGLCEVPDRLILKRNDKLLDYDNAQYKLDRNRDPTRTRILEEELSQAQGTYSALNTQLMMELPVLTKCGVEVLKLATNSLISARMYLQGRLAHLYLNLTQALGLALTGDVEEMLTQFRVKYLQQVGEFRQLSFVPGDSLQWSLPRPKGRQRKSIDGSASKREQTEAKTKVVGQYASEVVYVVREVHTPAEVMELTLYPGDHVALLKNKDPLGRTDRWFVDDGDNKGFVRASCLRPVLGSGSEGGPPSSAASNPPAAVDTSAVPRRPATPSSSRRPSTVPRPAPAPPEQAPPRYEDIFPIEPTTLPHQTPGYPQAPPPRYSSGGTLNTAQQPPLPSKPEPLPPTSGNVQEGDGDYYTPPLDRQQSGEYTSPVSEEHNIYEEIDQGAEGSRAEGATAGEADPSPIYEVIKDGEIVRDPEKESTVLDESVFYYALYNFGGSDATQLNLSAGQVVLVLHAVSSDWWFVEDRSGKQGYVPASYLTRYS